MARLFWWLVLAGVGWMLWRGVQRRHSQMPPPDRPAAPQVPDTRRELMVACARCGVHLPQHEALTDDRGRPYCCAAHRDAGAPH